MESPSTLFFGPCIPQGVAAALPERESAACSLPAACLCICNQLLTTVHGAGKWVVSPKNDEQRKLHLGNFPRVSAEQHRLVIAGWQDRLGAHLYLFLVSLLTHACCAGTLAFKLQECEDASCLPTLNRRAEQTTIGFCYQILCEPAAQHRTLGWLDKRLDALECPYLKPKAMVHDIFMYVFRIVCRQPGRSRV